MLSNITVGIWVTWFLLTAMNASAQPAGLALGWEKIENLTCNTRDSGQLLVRGERVYVSNGEVLNWSDDKGGSWNSITIPALPFEVSFDGSQIISGSRYKNLNEQTDWVEEVCTPVFWEKKTTCSFMGNDTLWIPSSYERVDIKTLNSSWDWISTEESWSDIQSQDNVTYGNIRTVHSNDRFIVATGYYQVFISKRDSIFFHDFGYENRPLNFQDCHMLDENAVVCVMATSQFGQKLKLSVLEFGIDLDSGLTRSKQDVFNHPLKDSLMEMKRFLIHDEHLFLATAKNLLISDKDWNWQTIALPVESTQINDLAVHPDGTLFLHTEGGLYKASTEETLPVRFLEQKGFTGKTNRLSVPGFYPGKEISGDRIFSIDGRVK